MKYCYFSLLVLLLVGCSEKKHVYAKGRIVSIEYQTIGGGYYRTKFLSTFKLNGAEHSGYALGDIHFCAISEAHVGDSILIKFEEDNLVEGVARDFFYLKKNRFGKPVDHTFYKGKYNQLE